MKKLLLLLSFLWAMAMQADVYTGLWQKAQKAQAAQKDRQTRECVDKIYKRALTEGNTLELTRALYAYQAMGVEMTEDSIVRNAKRVWNARRQERNAVQHALLTHLLGRLTDNDHLLALSIADTTFLKEVRIRGTLPLVRGYNLFELFTDYIRHRDMPDSVFVGWQRPQEEDTTVVRKHYNFDSPSYNDRREPPIIVPSGGDIPTPGRADESASTVRFNRPTSNTNTSATKTSEKPGESAEKAPAAPPAPAPLSGEFTAYVFNVPGGMSRTCLVETRSGTPVKRWRIFRSDGRGQENDISSDGNGHVWQRPTQIHNYDGIYDWHLRPVVTEQASVNTLTPKEFHHGECWGKAGEHNERELHIDIQKQDMKQGLYSITVRAPHRNLTLMRDITAGGRLIEQRQYQFSDFIHFDLKWREEYGDEGLVTFAYALNGHLYTAQLKIQRPRP